MKVENLNVYSDSKLVIHHIGCGCKARVPRTCIFRLMGHHMSIWDPLLVYHLIMENNFNEEMETIC